MPNPNPARRYEYLSELSTEKLEELLALEDDPNCDEATEEYVDAIINELLDRENSAPTGRLTDVDKSFRELKEYSEQTDDEPEPVFYKEDRTDGSQVTPIRKRRLSRRLYRAVVAAAIVLSILLACTATSYALGYDLWGAVATWSKETFGFEKADNDGLQKGSSPRTVPEQLVQLHEAMAEHGVGGDLLPTYLPEGYELAEFQCVPTENAVMFFCLLENNQDFLILQYMSHLSGNYSIEYEKEAPDPEVYEICGIAHYITNNDRAHSAIWVTNGVECAIHISVSREELLKIIESIYGG